MPNSFSPEALAEFFGQTSNDPFLTLVTLTHDDFDAPIYLVNNTTNITSRGNTYLAFPMTIRLAADDGESAREFSLNLDNVSLDLITNIREVTTRIGVKIEMILASLPDVVQMSQEDLLISNITYSAKSIDARVSMDSFLATEVTSERYFPNNFPGLF